MAGKLYLCATPIGNLEDITLRVLKTLREADLIAAEDTRNTLRLLNHFEIKTPMTSYHEHNKYDKARELIRRMKEGVNIALVTDAGTPAVSDPGEELVKMCRQEGVEVTSLPGPSACITALTLSGLSARRFCFEGFLPSGKKERRALLKELERETRTLILYASPHRLRETLAELLEALGERRISLCRELTKIHETVVETTLGEAVSALEEQEPRGEYVLVVEGRDRRELEEESRGEWLKLSVEEHVRRYEDQGLPEKEAMRQAARDRGVSRREIYQELQRKSE